MHPLHPYEHRIPTFDIYSIPSFYAIHFILLANQVPLFVLPRLFSSLWVSRTGSASDWCALQEALFKCIDTIQYNTIQPCFLINWRTLSHSCQNAIRMGCIQGLQLELWDMRILPRVTTCPSPLNIF